MEDLQTQTEILKTHLTDEERRNFEKMSYRLYPIDFVPGLGIYTYANRTATANFNLYADTVVCGWQHRSKTSPEANELAGNVNLRTFYLGLYHAATLIGGAFALGNGLQALLR